MKNKYFYPIFKLKAKSWIRYWLLKKTEFKGKLSEILEGFSFNLQNTLRQKFLKFEIEGHSIQDGEPSPENEVPILSSGDNGSITEKIVNRNLFDGEIELGSVYNGNKISSSSNYRSVNFIPVKANTNYSFSINGNLNKVIMNYYDNNKTWLGSSNPDGYQVLNGLFTTPDNTKYILFRSFANDFELFRNGNIQIELGSTATEYVAHEEQTYIIPVQQPMRSIGDVRDCFVKKSDGWYERHYIGRKVFDGTETFIGPYNTVDNTLKFHIDYTTGEQDKGLCNYFTKGLYSNRATDGVEHFYIGTTTLQFRVSTTIATTSTEFKTWIAGLYTNGTPLYADYILAESLDLPCTTEQIQQLENRPITYEGQTNVYSTDEVEPYLKIQYWESDTNG